MPSKNSQKLYLENGYYHIYNRGAGKSEIFLEDQDYRVFTHFLKKYLAPELKHSLASEVKLLAYCLMPNHFHFFVHQISKDEMVKLMRSLCTSYSMYFNKRYERSGTLFQGVYKAAIVETEPDFLHLSRYIHLNSHDLKGDWRKYPYSSYKAYLGEYKISWLDTAPILAFFKEAKTCGLFPKVLSYQLFVEDYSQDSKEELGELTLD